MNKIVLMDSLMMNKIVLMEKKKKIQLRKNKRKQLLTMTSVVEFLHCLQETITEYTVYIGTKNLYARMNSVQFSYN